MNKIIKFPQPQVVTVSVPTNFDNNVLEVSFTEKEWGLVLNGNLKTQTNFILYNINSRII